MSAQMPKQIRFLSAEKERALDRVVDQLQQAKGRQERNELFQKAAAIFGIQARESARDIDPDSWRNRTIYLLEVHRPGWRGYTIAYPIGRVG